MTRPPFIHNPPIKTYQSDAYALGALLALGDRALGVLDNSFINWVSSSELDRGPWPIRFIPRLSPATFASSNLGHQLTFRARNAGELVSAVLSSVEAGFLVRLIVDEFCIPDRWAFQIRTRVHDVLVIGAAKYAKHFELMGYCADGRYRQSDCPIENVIQGYFRAVPTVGDHGFIAFKGVLERPVLPVLSAIKYKLECFLQSRTSCNGENDGFLDGSGSPVFKHARYGLAVFDTCAGYMQKLTSLQYWDLRIFSVLYEHTKLMQVRLKRLEDGFHITVDKGAFARANQLATHLKWLSLIPSGRRNEDLRKAMVDIIMKLKAESQTSCESLRAGLANVDS